MNKKTPDILIVMGVSGCGKSTYGQMLANQTNTKYLDGDDYHPQSNIDKMSQGIALTDEDRHGWLTTLAALIKHHHKKQLLIIGCSALKQKYRDILSPECTHVEFIHLQGSYNLLYKRALKRAEVTDHFMDPELLKSQFDTLEPPTGDNVLSLSVEFPIHLLVAETILHYQLV